MNTIPRFGSTSLQLSGSGYADIGNPEGLQNLISFTLEAWVNMSTLDGNQTVISKFSQNDTGAFLLFITDGYPAAYYRTSPYYLQSSIQLEANQWHHLAVTYDSSKNQLTLYIDGVQEAQGTFAFKPITSSPENVLIGASGDQSSPNNYFKGMIGRIQIWKIARNLDEIVTDSLQARDPAAEPFLEAYFDFEELPAIDQSGNNYSITLNGDANYCMCIPALKLENNAYVDCGNDEDLSFGGTKPYTMEGWICPTGTGGTILSKYNDGVSGEYQIIYTDSMLEAWRNISPNEVNSKPIVSTNQYYHFAVVFDSEDKILNLYINGNLQASRYFLEDMPTDADTHFLIGANFQNSTPENFFEGHIQNIRIWNKALSLAEIRQWIYNQPVSEPYLAASFDFSTDPPVDNTDKHSIELKNGAIIEYQTLTIEPSDVPAQIGFMQSINASYMNQNRSIPDTPPTGIKIAKQPDLFSDEYFQALLGDLEEWMKRFSFPGKRQKFTRDQFKKSYEKAVRMVKENPDLLKPFTTIRKDGIVKVIHHSPQGDYVFFEGPSEIISDCTLWWIQFIYLLTIGFYQALGLIPGNMAIATKVYNLVSSNQTVMNAINSLLGQTITVSAGVTVIGVIWEEGLIWPLLKFAFTSAGWLTLFWILRKVIAFATGLEAAEILAGFIVWAAQLTLLSLEYWDSCGSPQLALEPQKP